MLSKEEYDRLEATDDHYWFLKAKAAEQSGFLGVEKGQKIIEQFLNAET